jgi:hypothetical protein
MSSASLHGRGYALRRLMGEDGGFDWQDSEKRFSDKQLALELKPMVQMFFEGFTSFHMLHDWPKDSYLMPMIELPVILTQMEGVDLDALANQSDEELY